ncbi:membrane protein [Herbaspirillum seropedicae SmR1]|uniref:Membrane protein n=1 Tax=Herbaspirillum seropedicae (strain SmR1) TaxID=757424 RepID=D8IQK1_HERSS|nr:membrane protein [Herbaspirillum seropedicae SmR1]
MKWEGNRESDNVEDRRGEDGGGGGFGFGGRSIGLGTVAVALVASYFLGINPLTMLSLLSGGSPAPVQQQAPAHKPSPNDQMARFVATVLADTEDTWDKIFAANGKQYVRPKLVLFSGSTPTACGTGQSATGPFYCPGDQKVYIDLSFYELMKQRFKVSGNFAQAYVIAHEVGHHVQHLMGISDKVDAARRNATEKQANAMSVRLELQADCFAGVWAYHANQARHILEEGDIESGPACGLRHRRRRPAAAGARRGRARFLHPRQLRAAHDLVQARHQRRQGQRLQYLRRQGTLIF